MGSSSSVQKKSSADVQVVGECAPGRAMHWAYMDGAVGPTDGLVYMIPFQAKRAVRFDPVSRVWEAFGDTFAKDQAKWVRAAVSNFDNCIYSIPCSLQTHTKVLKIDPANGTAKEVGKDVRQFAGGVTSWAWCGTVAASDGCIFGMPCSATSVLRLDPRTGKLSSFGQLEDTGGEKYFSGILGPSGRYIFGIPGRASRVLCIDTKTLAVRLIGEKTGGHASGHVQGGTKWIAGGIGGDGCVYCIPNEHTHVLRIDPIAMTTSLFGPKLPTSHRWSGGCAGPNGCVYGTPYGSPHILCIDPFTGHVSTVGNAIPSDSLHTHCGAVLGRDGDIWSLPFHGQARMIRLSLQSAMRQWLRVLGAIGDEGYTGQDDSRVDSEVLRLLRFFHDRPGLLRLVGAKIALFYSPNSAHSFQ